MSNSNRGLYLILETCEQGEYPIRKILLTIDECVEHLNNNPSLIMYVYVARVKAGDDPVYFDVIPETYVAMANTGGPHREELTGQLDEPAMREWLKAEGEKYKYHDIFNQYGSIIMVAAPTKRGAQLFGKDSVMIQAMPRTCRISEEPCKLS